MEEIRKTLREYVLREFLPEEDPEKLTDSTPLITGGMLSSLGTLQLVAFLEVTYGIAIEDQEVIVERLNSISNIAAFVRSKLQGSEKEGANGSG